ncbi:MAG TPA: AAA family ATPase, partial [Nannocystaceae bacterium]|nr:AAA family ATPase [Nannocystaceae bacterium]
PGGTWEPSRDAGLAALDRDELGPLDSFADRRAIEEALAQTDVASDPVGDAAALWSFAHDIQPGDPIIARRGASQFIGIGRVTSTYRFARERPTGQHVRAVEWLWTGTPVNLSDRLPLRLLTNTAGRTTLLDALQPLLTPDDPNLGPPPSPPTPYERRDLIDESFLDPARIDTMLALLRRKKNVILQGPPGVGKTWVARRLAYLLIGARDPSRVEMVQFHPAYTYEDFIRGYRAKGKEGFVVEDGIFLRFADLARGDPDSPYVLIIDEINRGNLGKIFGELMMLIEADKRGDEWSVALAHSRRDGEERFYVPDNLYILGTMNTADRSLALVDYALRRRFAFVSVPPGFASPRFAQAWGHAPGPLEALRAALHELNRMIDADPQLGSGFQLGHSYFCDPPAAPGGADAGPLDDRLAKWLRDVYRFEILPLLEEYWFDAPDKLKQARHLLGLPGAP